MTEIKPGAFYRNAEICENDKDGVLGLLSVKSEL